MKCLVTGASSGIGRDMSRILSKMGHEVIMVSSNNDKLNNASKYIANSKIYVCDLTKDDEVEKLIDYIRKEKPEIIINNAGYGLFGFYDEIDFESEENMIKLNIMCLQKITKVALEYMKNLKESYILNVSSMASFYPGGALLSSYYATKSYVTSYSLGLYQELKEKKINTSISILCPGPTNTNFNKVAGGSFNIKSLSSEKVASYAIKKMFNKKTIIIPGFSMKLGFLFKRLLPTKFLLSMVYKTHNKI